MSGSELPMKRQYGRKPEKDLKTKARSQKAKGVPMCYSLSYGVGGGTLTEYTSRVESEWDSVCVRVSGIFIVPPHGTSFPCRYHDVSCFLVLDETQAHHRKVSVMD